MIKKKTDANAKDLLLVPLAHLPFQIPEPNFEKAL